MRVGGQVEGRGEEPTLETKGEEPRQEFGLDEAGGWRAGDEDLATGHEFGRLTFGLLPPVELSFLIGGPVHLFRMLTVGRRKVGGVNLRSSRASVFPQPPLGSSQSQHRAGQGQPS